MSGPGSVEEAMGWDVEEWEDTSEEPVWGGREVDAWRLPRRLTVTEWAEKFRVLDPVTCAEPGPFRCSRTPYLRGIMDAFSDPEVSEITFKKCTQVGGSEAEYNMIGYVIAEDPAPTLLVLPNQDLAKRVSNERIKPMIEATPVLKAQKPRYMDEFNTLEYRMARMNLIFGYSGSATSLGSTPVKFIFMDETNKFTRYAGREASPQKLAAERKKTFWDAKVVKTSTPTDQFGYITVEYELTDKCLYHVPCPHCHQYQPMWRAQIHWPEGEGADRIRNEKLAYYVCRECGGEILDRHKPQMLLAGLWVPEGCGVVDGHVEGEPRVRGHRGFWLNACYSPWLTFSDYAAEVLDSEGDPAKEMNLVNSWDGAEWVETISEQKADVVRINLVSGYQRGEVPKGVQLITAGVDVQISYGYVVIRGWGYGEESWLIDAGTVPLPKFDVEGWPALEEALFQQPYRNAHGDVVTVSAVFIDSGYRTDEVYSWCRKRNEICKPTKGRDRSSGHHLQMTSIDKHPVTGKALPAGAGIMLFLIDTDYYKTKLYRLMTTEPGQGKWHLFEGVTSDYLEQITSERKVIDRDAKGKQSERWEVKERGLQNHYLDAEVLNLAAADLRRVSELVDPGSHPVPGVNKARLATQRMKRVGSWVPEGGWKI